LGAFAVREESHDLIERLQSGRRLPVIDSSCPAAVKYIEQAYPELIYHLTTCRSPQQIGGALYKSYGAKMWGVGPGSIYSVSVGPCTSRKLEAGRNTPRASLPASAGGAPLAALPDGKADLQGKSREVDAVLTTRELAYLLKDAGVDPFAASSEEFDQDLLDRSWLSHVYCSTGDIAQAVLETCCELLNREVRSPLNLASADAGADGARVTSVETDGYEIKALSVSGVGSAIPFLDAIKAGKIGFAFMEVRACPAGCVSGGGQPKVLLPKDKPRAYIERATVTSLTSAGDRVEITEDSTVQRLYVKHFGMPCGDKSNRILHTPWE